MSSQRVPAPLAGLVAVVVAASVVLLAVAALQWQDEELVLLGALCALVVVSELLDFAPFGNSRISLSVALILVAGTVSGLPGVALVVSVAVIVDFVVHPKPLYKAAFNEGVLLLAGAAYVGVFEAFSIGYRGENWPDVIAPAILGAALNFVVNSVLITFAIAIDTRGNPFSIWNEKFRWLFPHYVIVGVLAVTMATAYQRWELAGVALLLVPLAMVWLALRQHAGMASALARRLQSA
ncbi:MAG: hypothetical protein IIA91_00245 [Chloroflexi bacterium]|nr:hypothetical protein [Chloroflexota bacterium]